MQVEVIPPKQTSTGAYFARHRKSAGKMLCDVAKELSLNIEDVQSFENGCGARLSVFFKYAKLLKITMELCKGTALYKLMPVGENAMIKEYKRKNWKFLQPLDYNNFEEFCHDMKMRGMELRLTESDIQVFTPEHRVTLKKDNNGFEEYAKLSGNDKGRIKNIIKGRGTRVANETCSWCGLKFRIGWEYKTVEGKYIGLCSACHAKHIASGYNGPIIPVSMGGHNK